MRKYEERRRKKKVGERKKEEGKEEENCWAGGCELVYKKNRPRVLFGSAVLYDVYV